VRKNDGGDDVRFAYGCCVGSWEKFQRNVVPHVGPNRPLLALAGSDSIVFTYNLILDAFAGDVDALVLLHDDLEITDPDAELKFADALAEDDVELVGVAGGGGKSLYWWEHDPVGHQPTDVMNIDFGRRTGDVELIEGSIMVLSRWAIENVRFDSRFTGFHGYDEIAMQVRAQGKRVVVEDVDTHHHNPMGYRSPESAAECRRANQLYREKWNLQ